MAETPKGIILVTGATGTQGGAVASTLLAANWPVRILVRDPNSIAALSLADRGAQIIVGDLDNTDALERATAGVYGVFSVPIVGMEDDVELELRAGGKLIAAAKTADVKIVVHSSVAQVDKHEQFVDWALGKWWPRYWLDKAAYNDIVRKTEFPYYTILKPSILMDCFIPPKSYFMFPHLTEGRLITALKPGMPLDVIAASDVASFALAAFSDPDRFRGAEIELAAERLNMNDAAAVISRATGVPIEPVYVPPEEAEKTGVMIGEQPFGKHGEVFKVDIGALKKWNVPLTSFKDWAIKNADMFDVGPR